MASKKNTAHATHPKTHKVRQRKGAEVENLPAEEPAPAEMVLTESAQPPVNPPVAAEAAATVSDPAAVSSKLVTPTPAEETTTATADSSPEATAPANKLSALDAAAKVLGETGQAMNCQELIAAMGAMGYWSSPKGRTPAGTLYSAVLRELKTKGDKARFRKTARGKFTLRDNV